MTQPTYPYDQSSSAPAPSSYPPAPGYPAPAYQSAPAYPTSPYASAPGYPGQPTPPAKKSPLLGIIGLAVVVVCTVIYFVSCQTMMRATLDALGPEILNGSTTVDTTALANALQASGVNGAAMAFLFSSLFGLAGLIISIVATVQNKGRIFGIIGIVLGVLAPFSLFIASGMAVAAY